MSEQELSEERVKQLLDEAAQELPEKIDLWPAIKASLPDKQIAPDFARIEPLSVSDNSSKAAKQWRRFTLVGLAVAALLAIFLIAGPLLFFFSQSNQSNRLSSSAVIPVPTPTPTIAAAPGVTGTLITTLTGYDKAVRSLAWSLDGKTLASGSEGNMLKLWTADGKPLATINDLPGGLFPLRWSPDGKYFVTSDGQIFDAQGNLTRADMGGEFGGWSPDGKLLAIYDHDGRMIHLERAADRTLAANISISEGYLGKIAWSPDGKTLVTGGQNVAQGGLSNIRLWFWRTDGTLITTVEDFYYPFSSLAFSPDGKTLAVSAKGQARLLDPNGKTLVDLSSKEYVIWDFAWSPDGKYLAAACSDNTVRIFSPDGNLRATLAGHKDSVWTVAWSPDGRTLASGSGDQTVKLWKISP